MTDQALDAILFDGLNLTTGLEAKLWDAADQLRANSTLKASEYSTPVLGLIFLKYADNKFKEAERQIADKIRPYDEEADIRKLYIAECGFFLPEEARYDYLLEGHYKARHEGRQTLQKAIIAAMDAIEAHNESLNGTLPKQQYTNIADDDILESLLKAFSVIPMDAEGDLFGKIYEYFLGKFALAEGQKGGQFFTPTSIVKLIVEVIEPFRGKIYDPSCGSGGMFVQSAKFIKKHQSPARDKANKAQLLSIYGQERTKDTVDLAKMNLAVNGLNGDIQNVNSYYEDPFHLDRYISENNQGPFDYVMANPPFNVDGVQEEKLKDAVRFSQYGLPSKKDAKKTSSKKATKKVATFGNANYLWANLFGSALNQQGRAGFVMANSASDARGVEQEVRQNILHDDIVDVVMAISSNFFISVTLPITLWFYDKGKTEDRQGKTLFLDARNIYTQVTRALRTFTDCQLYNITAVVWLYRGEHDKYQQLLQRYQQALEQWQNGPIANPTNAEMPYEGIKKAEAALRQALPPLQKTLQTWYDEVKGLFPEGTSQVVETLTETNAQGEETTTTIKFANKLAQLNSTPTTADETTVSYKALQDLVLFADRQLKIKGNKAFGRLKVKDLLKKATTAYEHREFIQERINYFSQHLEWHQKRFPEGQYQDVEGLCKIAHTGEVTEQGHSLNPGRYVGVALEEDNLTAEEFKADMQALHARFAQLNQQAHQLEKTIEDNLKEML